MADFYGKMYNDFKKLPKPTIGGQSKGLIPGFTNADLAGLGVQLSGGIIGDIAEQGIRRDELDFKKLQNRQNIILEGRRARKAEDDSVTAAQENLRGQNINAFDRMMKSRETARQNASKYSFRRSMLRGLGG